MYETKKWQKVRELIGHVAEDSTLDNCYKDLKCLCYAPNVGFRAWIFKYKGLLVSLWDLGNGHYNFDSIVSHWDLFVAKLIEVRDDRYRKRLMRKEVDH